jgi:hypothetical protein
MLLRKNLLFSAQNLLNGNLTPKISRIPFRKTQKAQQEEGEDMGKTQET